MVKTNIRTAGEIIRFMKNLGYEVRKPERKSVADKLLGAFEGAVPEGKTGKEYLKNSGRAVMGSFPNSKSCYLCNNY